MTNVPLSTSFIIMGIDPGFKGGISFLNPITMQVNSFPMPIIKDKKKKTRLDVSKIVALVEEFMPSECVIEKNQPRPGQGISSAYTFGYWSGFFEGLTAGHLMPITLVPPQVWMKAMFSITVSGVKSSKDLCVSFWPNNDWRGTKRSRIVHDGMTDSSVLALYIARKLNIGN